MRAMPFPDLRREFTGTHLPETVVHLTGARGATQRSADEFLAVTYPTADVVACLRAVSVDRSARPLVLKGERGRGKSHLMAVIHHAVESPDQVEAWAEDWAKNRGVTALAGLKLARGFKAISRTINDNEDGIFLWDVLFNNHPQGALARVQYEQKKTDAPQPAQSIYEQIFKVQPTCLILDEFQTWFEGLPEQDGNRLPRNWAFNAIQLLSQIAEQHPDRLILVVSVRSNTSDSFNQLQRVNPQLVDFGGPTAVDDRRRLLQHRLFTNRSTFTRSQIGSQVATYAEERVRLRFGHVAVPDQQAKRDEVVDCWPFSPELLDLLEQQILLSENAQETREAIKILAALSRVHGGEDALLTPADFHVDGSGDTARALLTSIAQGDQEKLGEIAGANLREVLQCGQSLPHARDIISSLWVRSLGSTKQAGGDRRELQLDVTRSIALDDNAFRAELTALVDNSVNIHGEVDDHKHLSLGPQENPKTKVRVTARNDREWEPGGHHVGMDILHLRETVVHLLQPEGKDLPVRVVVMGPQWKTAPWTEVPDVRQHPAAWDKPALIVLPDAPELHGSKRDAVLGAWLKTHVTKHRNWVRFLLPHVGMAGLFADAELRQLARCSYLTSRKAWGTPGSVYFDQHNFFDKQLRSKLQARFARFAVLHRWNFVQPELCAFTEEAVDANTLREKSGVVVHAVEALVAEKCFDPLAFRARAVSMSKQNKTVGDLLMDFEDPDPLRDCLPHLGDNAIQERLIDLVAANDIAIRSAGTWYRQPPGLSPEEARQTLRARLSRVGSEQRQMELGDPAAIPSGNPIPAPAPQPPLPPPVSALGGTTSAPPTGGTSPLPPLPGLQSMSRGVQPASKTNLINWLEQQHDLPTGVPLEATLTLQGLTPTQIRHLLNSMPVTMQAALVLKWIQPPETSSGTEH